jgi:hypothetical protein
MSDSKDIDPVARYRMRDRVLARKAALETAQEDWFLPLIF